MSEVPCSNGSVLQRDAVCCSVLQCVAVDVRGTLFKRQCVAACCSVLQWMSEVPCLNGTVLQCVAVCCSVLQCVAVDV